MYTDFFITEVCILLILWKVPLTLVFFSVLWYFWLDGLSSCKVPILCRVGC